MKYIDEVVVIAALLMGIAFVAAGDNDKGLTAFLTALVYVFGRTRKINGELSNLVGKK